MKHIISLLLLLFTGSIIFAQNTNKRIFGVSTGYAFKYENSVYIDFGDYSTWPDHLGNAMFNVFYEYMFTSSFKMGVNLNYEKSKIDDFYLGKSSAKKYMWGFHWIGQYPRKPLHGELGGYFKTGVLIHEEFDKNPKGIEYGIIAGPAMDIGKISLALHFQAGMSYFFQDESPTDILVFYPQLLFKLGYCF